MHGRAAVVVGYVTRFASFFLDVEFDFDSAKIFVQALCKFIAGFYILATREEQDEIGVSIHHLPYASYA